MIHRITIGVICAILFLLTGCTGSLVAQSPPDQLTNTVHLVVRNAVPPASGPAKLRVFERDSKRTFIAVKPGDTIVWHLTGKQELKFQFPTEVGRFLEFSEESMNWMDNDDGTWFSLMETRTLSGIVKEWGDKMYVMEYAIFDSTAGTYVAGTSPPKIIFVPTR